MNVEKDIGALLDAIYSQNYEGEIEVVILDSSDDKTAEIVKSYPVKFMRVEPEDFTFGKARNAGAAMTSGDFLILISSDIEIRDKMWLSKLTRHFADPKVAGIYGRQLPREHAYPMEKFFISYIYKAQSITLILEDGKLKQRRPVFFSNVNSAIRRSVWEEIRIPEMIGAEDQEWAKRVLRAGYKIVYDSDTVVYHSHNRSLSEVFQAYFMFGATMPIIRANPIIGFSMKDFICDGLDFIWKEYKYVFKNGYWYWIPYAIVYDITKFLGVFIGAKQKYLPIWIKRALYTKSSYWDSHTDVIKEPI